MVSFLFSKTRQDTCRGHLWGMKSARITIQIIQLLKSHCRRVSSQYWLLGRANRNILAPIIAQWLMSTATISSKSNYSDKVNRMLIWISCKKMEEKLVTQSESAMSTDISNTLEFLMMIFSRNESGIEYHRSICIFCYYHFNSGSIYTVLSTNEEASQASRCHSSGKCPLLPSLSFKYLSFCQQRENLRMKYTILSFLIKYFSCTWMAHIER